MVSNHWTDGGDLVIEEKTLMRPAGWLTANGRFTTMEPFGTTLPYSPVYQQISTWVDGEGWHD